MRDERDTIRQLDKYAPFDIQIIGLTIEHAIRKFKINKKTYIIYSPNLLVIVIVE